MTAKNRGVVRSPGDYYRTPLWAIGALLETETISGRVLDPGCGDGAILSALRGRPEIAMAVGVEVDISLAERAREGVDVVHADFLRWAVDEGDEAFDVVVGNPPYSLASEFARAALGCVRPGGKVCLLLRLGFLGSSRTRMDLVGRESCLDRVIVLSRRPSFTGDGRTDSATYAWLVWIRDRPPGTGARLTVSEAREVGRR